MFLFLGCILAPSSPKVWQDLTKMAQDGPKLPPSWPKMPPSCPQDGTKMAPRWHQDGPKIALKIIKNLRKINVSALGLHSGPKQARDGSSGAPR